MEVSDISGKSGLNKMHRFNQVYDSVHQAVYANILKIVQKPEAAEDLLQDVFVAFWEKIDDLDMERAANWLFVVSFNRAISYIKRKHLVLAGEPDENLPEHEIELDEEEFSMKLSLIHQAIDELPERKKIIFKAHKLEGKPLEEIAAEMELSVHTIKDHLKIANKLIRKQVSEKATYSATSSLSLYLFLLTS